ncbi:MAG TPA: carboxypeptidase regulatory-like domain-containing protein [bacterium]
MDGARHILGLAALAAGLLMAVNARAGAGDEPVSDGGATRRPPVRAFVGVRGVVTDTAGAPLAEVGIAVTAGTSPVPEMLRLTAPDGSYSWPLPPGTYSLTASPTLGGYRPQTLEVTVPEGGTARLDFQLQAEP